MGNCFEPQNPNSQRDKEVNKIISRELKTRDELKLLLLGGFFFFWRFWYHFFFWQLIDNLIIIAGESGKSTIFKQMRIIHKKGSTTHLFLQIWSKISQLFIDFLSNPHPF